MAEAMKLSRSMPWLLFGGDRFYPQGGSLDFLGSFASITSALAALHRLPIDHSDSWAQIVDLRTGAVREFKGEHGRYIDPETVTERRTAEASWIEGASDG